MLINGKAYAWDSITARFGGVVIEGCKGVKFKRKVNKQNNYGRGTKPISRGRGNHEFEASITVEMKEYVRILAALPNGKTGTDIAPSPLLIAWIDEENKMFNVTLEDAEIDEEGLEVAQGDMNIDVELPLIISDIKYS
jgi:hypothetical protein